MFDIFDIFEPRVDSSAAVTHHVCGCQRSTSYIVGLVSAASRRRWEQNTCTDSSHLTPELAPAQRCAY